MQRPVYARKSNAGRTRRALRLSLLLAVSAGSRGGAQQASAAAELPPLYTLHVSSNLVQIPTLVLDSEGKQVESLARDRFDLRLDSGPPFHPTAMHVEGDDSITLAVLLDASGNQADLLKHFADALAALVPDYLYAHDHISIYALDCTLISTAVDVQANALVLKSGVVAALDAAPLHGARAKGCLGTAHLRDAIVTIAEIIGDSPGRRVILAVTDGRDDKSKDRWSETQRFAATHGVALFAVRDSSNFFGNIYPGQAVPKSLTDFNATRSYADEDLFRILCESSGGLLLGSTAQQLTATLQKFVTLLRKRYILEFPRPNDNRPGLHNVQIFLPGTTKLIFHTGVTVQPRDPAALADPDTLPDAKSPATYGNRHPITPNF